MIIALAQNTDDSIIRQVAELIYGTDDFAFPYLFGPRERAIKKIEGLIRRDNNLFSAGKILADIENNEVRGILIGYDPATLKNEVEDFLSVFSLPDSFLLMLKSVLLFPLADRSSIKGPYIQIISTAERHRGKGIASGLIDHYCALLREQRENQVTLDVALGNDGARRLYERKGFRPVQEWSIPFTSLGICRMEMSLVSTPPIHRGGIAACRGLLVTQKTRHYLPGGWSS